MHGLSNLVPLSLFCAAAAACDMRLRRIPNLLNLTGVTCGIFLWTACSGARGLRCSIAGAALGLGMLLVPFFLKMVGGGDVKFMAAAGSMIGWPLIWPAFVAGACLGGLFAVGSLAFKDRSLTGVRGEMVLLLSGSISPRGSRIGVRIPYAVPLSAGLLIVACINSI